MICFNVKKLGEGLMEDMIELYGNCSFCEEISVKIFKSPLKENQYVCKSCFDTLTEIKKFKELPKEEKDRIIKETITFGKTLSKLGLISFYKLWLKFIKNRKNFN